MVVTSITLTRVNAQESNDKARSEKEKVLKEKQKQKKELDSVAIQSRSEYEKELQMLIEERKKGSASDYFDDTYQDFREQKQVEIISRSFPNVISLNTPPPFIHQYGSSDNASFNISKKMKENSSFGGDFEFSVPDKPKGINFFFAGGLENGSLKITITKPDKKVFQEFKVSPIADVNWNKKINIKEEELKDYMGSWKITIVAQDAKGFYELRISAY